MHDGSIAAASEGHGRGAQFTVRLAVEATGTPPPAPVVPTLNRARTILIVEDNDAARESLPLLLESLGHRVLAAADGPPGAALALNHQPTVIRIGLALPRLAPHESARAVPPAPARR